MENPIKMDDLGVPLFLETPIWTVCLPSNMQMFFGTLPPIIMEVETGPLRNSSHLPGPFSASMIIGERDFCNLKLYRF